MSYLRSLARVSRPRIAAAASYKPKVFYSTASEKYFEREMHELLQEHIMNDLKDVSDLETELQKDIKRSTELLFAKLPDIENSKKGLERLKFESFNYVACTVTVHAFLMASIGFFRYCS